jgi:hypothetical protein
MGTERGALTPEVKRPRGEADHSSAIGAKVKNIWVYTYTPALIRLHGVVLN